MTVFTAIALAIIRISYFNLLGPDADPNGMYKHFAIDFFGMAVHILIAASLVSFTRLLGRMVNRTQMLPNE